MPYKRRGGSKQREHVITPQAVELYARAKRLARSNGNASELNDVSYALAAELKLRPWMTCPLDIVALGYSRPEWEADDEWWWKSAALADELETALQAKRKAEREARKAINPTNRDDPAPPAPPQAAE